MGLENPLHIILLLVVILLVFGAKRLPEIGRSLGEGLRGFKDSISGESHHHQDSLTSAPAAAPPAPAPATVVPTAAPAPAPVEDTAASPSPTAS